MENRRALLGTWRAALLWYLAIAAIVCLFRLGSTGAIYNEGIVADGARHMARTGDLVVPHLYHEVYTYKPPLTNWLVLASFQLTGRETTWTLRLPIALASILLGLAVLVGVGRTCGPRLGALGAIATLTGGLMLERVRIAEPDLPLAVGVGVAILAASSNLLAERPRTAIWALCYLALAFGFLAKGVPALMAFFPGLVLAAWWTGRLRRLASPTHLAGLTLLVVAVVAYLWLSRSASGAAVFAQPLGEARARGVAWDWTALGLTLIKPLAVLAAFLPWSLFLPLAVASRPAREGGRALASASGLLLAGLGFIAGSLVAFMAVPSFEVRYFLPLAVPIGLVGGLVAGGALEIPPRLERTGRRAALACTGIAALAALALGAWRLPTADGAVLVACGAAAAAVLLRSRLARQGTARVTIAGALCLWAVLVFAVTPTRAGKRTLKAAAEGFEPLVPEDAWLWVPPSAGEESSLVFHLDRPAFRILADNRPLPGSLALLTPEQLASPPPGSEAGSGLRWAELARGGNDEDVFVLSRLELEECELGPHVFDSRVTRLYGGLLGRAPTAVESVTRRSELASGRALRAIARELVGSVEFRDRLEVGERKLVRRLFVELLGRRPDPGGRATTLEALERGGAAERAVSMMMSDEFQKKNPYCGEA